MEKKGILLTHRHISWLLSLFIVSSFFVFVVGYFLGKKKAVEKFYNKVDQESLSDHIYYSVCSMYEDDENSVKQESTEDNSREDSPDDAVNLSEIDSVESIEEQTIIEKEDNISKEDAKAKLEAATVNDKKHVEIKSNEIFYAELIGFGTLGAANKFSEKLKRQGFSVLLKKRRSTSAKGKTITWYQVVTEKFDNKSDLIAFVDIIKDKEKLKGVRIVQG